jgi:hypothetical protein
MIESLPVASVTGVFEMIGSGSHYLRVNTLDGVGEIVRRDTREKVCEVLDYILEETLPQLHKLTQLGEPPTIEERKKQGSWRLGWREMGLDGVNYDWYVMVQ